MKRVIPFGTKTVAVDLPDRTFVIETEARKKLPAINDLGAAVDEALANPLGMPRLAELARPGMKVTIAFDDATVPAYSPIRGTAIKAVLKEIEAEGVKREDVVLICAGGLHRKFRPEELAMIVGADLVQEFGERLFCHDAEDLENMVHLGVTENGYDVDISRYVVDADLMVYVNASQNRGFAGGWKSITVGLGNWNSIRHHHGPDGTSMSVKDNRMHQVMDEMGRFIESKIDTILFKIDTLESNFIQISKVYAGSTWDCHKACLDVAIELFPPRRSLSKEKYDVIVYGVPDWSPYATYSHMNPLLTLSSSGLGYFGGPIRALGKEGCTVIMATPCPMRWDRVTHAPYPVVWETMLSETNDPYEIDRRFGEDFAANEELIQKYRHEYSFHPVHGIMASHPLKRLKHARNVIVAGIEEPGTAHHVGFEAAATVEEAIGMAEDIHGNDCRIAYTDLPAVTSPTKVAM